MDRLFQFSCQILFGLVPDQESKSEWSSFTPGALRWRIPRRLYFGVTFAPAFKTFILFKKKLV